MQSPITIIRTNKFTYTFFCKDNTLFVATASGQMVIAEGCTPQFSVCLGQNNLPVVFHKDAQGGAFLTSFAQGGKQESRRLMPGAKFTAAENCCYFQNYGVGPCFFHGEIGEGQKPGDIFVTDFSSNKEKQIRLGAFVPMKKAQYYVFGNDLPIVFFCSGLNTLSLCLFNKNIDNFSIYTVSKKCAAITDISCVYYEGRLHIAYILEDDAGCHLMYKYLEAGVVTAGKIILNCKKPASVFIFVSQCNLFVFAISQQKGIYSFSNNNGNSFYPTARFFKDVPLVAKAKYMQTDNAFEVPVDERFTPLILEDFAPPSTGHVLQAKYERLREQVVSYESNLKDKSIKYQEITNALNENQQQNDQLMYSWRVKFDQMAEENTIAITENEKLKEDILALQDKNRELKTYIMELEELRGNFVPEEEVTADSDSDFT